MNAEIRNFAIAAALLLAAGVGWYFGYVQPREEFLLAVSDCTSQAPAHADPKAEWDRCVAVVRQEQVQ